MEGHSEEHQRAVTRAIFRWYRRQGRTLPWRNIRDPYRILVAEIMLHQTGVRRVLQLYPEFLRRFPSLRALAEAPQADVIIAWRGMGYNNRAVRLHRLSRQLLAQSGGKFPRTLQGCMALPGVGKYTAHALLVSVYARDLPVVDVNIRRLLSRLFWRMQTTAQLQSEGKVWAHAASLVPEGRGYEWTQALMDIGAEICTARAPRCHACPVGRQCMSRLAMKPARPHARRREPSWFGIPNRLYRGKIVDALRSSRSGLTVRQLGATVLEKQARGQTLWLRMLISGLEKDGLVRVRGNIKRAEARVHLA